MTRIWRIVSDDKSGLDVLIDEEEAEEMDNRESEPLLHRETTEIILRAFYDVYNGLGYGFLEKVYENSLALKLRHTGLKVMTQCPIRVYFEGSLVGEYFADLIINETVLIEIKAAESLRREHEAQLTNYLKATPIEVGLLLNFGPRPEFSRKVFMNRRKPHLTHKSNPS
ncbi:MAG: GxxExxY protein [Planctomycetaceae bacterium]|nr:GxxExxY protein [Planctomycetaceae bacterium]